MKWVRLAKYLETSGDTVDGVYQRRRSGAWTEGLQSKVGPDGKIWVNQEEVDNWVDSHQPSHQPISRAA